MARKFLISRVALAVALSSGLACAAAPSAAWAAKKEKAPKGGAFSKEFAAAAADFDKTMAEAANNPAVKAASDKAAAAKDPASKAAAAAEVDAALGGADAKLAAATAAASTPMDKLKLGELIRNVGVLKADPAIQHKGLVSMIDSGAAQPEMLGQLQWLAGVTAYQGADYANAIKYLKPAYDSGYRDQQGMIDKVLADAYKRTNNSGAALQMAQAEIERAKAGGQKPSEGALRTALQAAYDAKQAAPATTLAAQLAEYYPAPASWQAAVGVVRSVNSMQPSEELDLMRLMARTGSLDTRNDYLSYLQGFDARRLPGEAIKIIDQGVASGKLSQSDVADVRAQAAGRIAADKASLPAADKDARAASATFAAINGAADSFLSYDQPAKAEELYKLALPKAGAEKDRVLVRLGIAQADQGKYADAEKTFAQVGGTRAPVAKMWQAYIKSKTAGAAAPASAAAPTS